MLFSHLIQFAMKTRHNEKASLKYPPHCRSLFPHTDRQFHSYKLFATILETGKRHLCRKHHICVFLCDHHPLHPTPNKLQLLQGDHPAGDRVEIWNRGLRNWIQVLKPSSLFLHLVMSVDKDNTLPQNNCSVICKCNIDKEDICKKRKYVLYLW